MEKAKNGGGSVGSGGLSSLHLAGSSGGSSSSAAASSVGNGVGGGGGGGGSPLLYTEQIEVSTSYDTSEQDSNGSCSNSNGPMQIIQQQQQPMQPMQHGKPAKIGAGGSGSFSGAGISIISAASILEGGSGSSSSSSPSSSSNSSFSTLSPSPVTATYSAGPSSSSLKSGGTVLINGGGGSTNGTTLRPVMQLAKNGSLGGIGGSGTSKIIVQNPQHKNGGQPHVIHVTTSPAASAMLANGVGLGGLGGLGGGGNITAMSSSGKPIIITSAQLSAAAANGTLTVINGQNGKCK